MRIVIGKGHPKDVHLWKNIINNLMNHGHEIKIVVWDKDITLYLLDTYGFSYEILGKSYKSMLRKAYGLFISELISLKVAKNFKPDILVGSESCLAHVSKLIRKPFIAFVDTEHATLTNWLKFPFSDAICTPSCYNKKLNPAKQITFNGYLELAYLHPNYFEPDPSVLDEAGVSRRDVFIILRFISWSASHDVGLRGIDKQAELDFIKCLEKYGHVFITSERKLDRKLDKYRIIIPPEKIHSLLYYADLYIGEGGTMATEAAILGTPAIHIESTSKGIATGNFSGNFLELRDKYGLLYFYPDQNQALKKAISILEDKNSKNEWRKRRERLLKDKIDVTAWMVDFIERYPESFYEYKEKYDAHSCISS